MKLTKKMIEEYNKKGVLIIPDVFTLEEMQELKRQAYSVDPADISRAGYPHRPSEQAKNKRSLIFFPALANDYINKIRTDERMEKIVTHFLGDGDIKQVNNQIYFREAGDEDEFAWHQDIVFRTPRDMFPNVEEGYLQTIIAVDDMTPTNGGIEFIEGSHLHGEQDITSNPALTKMLRYFKRMNMFGEKYTVKAGSVMVWNVLTVHGSEANQSDADRMTYMNGFCKAENCLGYPYYRKNGAIAPLEAQLIP